MSAETEFIRGMLEANPGCARISNGGLAAFFLGGENEDVLMGMKADEGTNFKLMSQDVFNATLQEYIDAGKVFKIPD